MSKSLPLKKKKNKRRLLRTSLMATLKKLLPRKLKLSLKK
jgi:hypothetical protein